MGADASQRTRSRMSESSPSLSRSRTPALLAQLRGSERTSSRGLRVRAISHLALGGLITLSAPVALLMCPATAGAQESGAQDGGDGFQRRVLVGRMGGAKTESAREWLTAGLAGRGAYELVADDSAKSLAADATQTEIASAAATHMADVVILARSVYKGKKGWSAEVSVYDGLDGHLLRTVEISAPTFDAYETELKNPEELDPVIAEAPGWPREQQGAEPATTSEESPDSSEDSSQEKERPSPLRAVVGARLYSRAFRYTDGLWQLFPNAGFREGLVYSGQAMMPRVDVAWYPAAHVSAGWAAHLGLVGGYEVAFPGSLAYPGATLSQAHSLWFVGARARLPLGAVTLGLQADYASHDFSVTGDEALPNYPASSPFPDVTYSQLEVGADLEWRIESMILGGHFSLDIVLDEGQIGASIGAATQHPWFPSTSALGADFGVYTGWQLSRVFDLLAGVDMRAYGLDFGPIDPTSVNATTTVVAGGATDRYLSFWAGLGIHWPSPDARRALDSGASGGDPDAGGDDGASDDFDDF